MINRKKTVDTLRNASSRRFNDEECSVFSQVLRWVVSVLNPDSTIAFVSYLNITEALIIGKNVLCSNSFGFK